MKPSERIDAVRRSDPLGLLNFDPGRITKEIAAILDEMHEKLEKQKGQEAPVSPTTTSSVASDPKEL